MNCPRCGFDLPATALFCSQCGHSLELKSRQSPQRDDRLQTQAMASQNSGEDDEYELWHGRYSAKGMINYWLVAILATLLLPLVAGMVGLDRVGWIGLLALILLLWLGLAGLLAWQKLDVHYVLTNQRLIHKSGIVTRHSNRIEVIDFDDVSYHQGIIERIVGVGTIEVVSSDRTDPVLELIGIDRVQEVAGMMDEARRAERIRRGLHIEAV